MKKHWKILITVYLFFIISCTLHVLFMCYENPLFLFSSMFYILVSIYILAIFVLAIFLHYIRFLEKEENDDLWARQRESENSNFDYDNSVYINSIYLHLS